MPEPLAVQILGLVVSDAGVEVRALAAAILAIQWAPVDEVLRACVCVHVVKVRSRSYIRESVLIGFV